VTHHDRADVRALWNELEGLAEAREENGAPVTLTSCAVKAVVSAMERFPRFASTLDPGSGELILKEYRHIGVAVDTERGLVVPVVRDVDRRSLVEVAAQVADLAHRAREGRLDPEDLRGGVFTVTNLGGIGGTGFTPIVRHPEVAILGLARATPAEEHTWLPLSLSYDHRVIDGADAARFCCLVAELLESPLRLLGRG